MIFDAILLIPATLITFFSSLFPIGSLPSFVSSAFDTANSSLRLLGSFIPLSDLFTALGFIIALEIAILIFKFFRWVFSHVPLVGGSAS